MAIPKLIHYCWFGRGEKSELIKKCIKSWSLLEGYKIIEWNEDNFDIESHPFVGKAYKNKKYAFVSDYVRLRALYEYGGVYLDTDVEIKKDIRIFLENEFFIGFMYDCVLGTALIGSNKNNSIISDLLSKYDRLELDDNPNNNIITQYFIDKFPKFRLNNRLQIVDEKVVIYPKEYFERPTFNKKIDYSEHYYTSTWKAKNNKDIIKWILKCLLGNVLYKKLTHKLSLKKTPFYDIYLMHKNQ